MAFVTGDVVATPGEETPFKVVFKQGETVLIAELCRRWADLAESPSPTSGLGRTAPIATSGVLLEFGRGLRSEE